MLKSLTRASGIAFVVMCSPSLAASSATESPASGSLQPQGAANWTGLYIGTNLAFGMAATELVIVDAFDWNAAGAKGPSGGAFAGYNHRFGDWVAGVEFGGTLSNVQGHTELGLGGSEFGTQTLTDWSAGLSARLGYLVSPDTLLFAGLGGKVFHGAGRVEIDGNTIYEEDDQFFGLGTVNVGIETAIGRNWRVRAQYDADFLQTKDYGWLTVTPLVGTAKASLIYAFGNQASQTATSVNAQQWAGLYAGLVGGQSLGVAELHIGDNVIFLNHNGLGSSGWTGGVVAGYNLNVSERVLLGLEGGVYRSTLRTFVGLAAEEDGYEGANDWWIDARLRAGFLTSQDTMIYGFVGLNRTHSTLALFDNGVPFGETETLERNGATVGAGIETRIANNLTVRGEYAYTLLEAADLIDGVPELGTMKQDQQTASVGLMYHLDN